jgi:tetratricopeptide (TPR) repeat protein
MSALLQSFVSGLLALCASVFSLVAAVLPLSGPQDAEAEFGLGLPPFPLRPPEVVVATNLTVQTAEQLRREIDLGLARHSAAITSTLNALEPALAQLQARQLEAVQSLNRTVLIVAAIFGATSLLGLVGITSILVRALGRFSELAADGPAHRGHRLKAAAPEVSLAAPEFMPTPAGAADQASARFQSAIDQLQKRILELEHNLHESRTNDGGGPIQGSAPLANSNGVVLDSTAAALARVRPRSTAASAGENAAGSASHGSVLIGKGQALLNLDAVEEALACFDEVLGFDPGNTEALVRKGLAFEKLQNWEQALDNYNRAIAADGSLTIAYLYKGGVCNRLQRHKEALESYEQALQTESKSRAP